jgi:hypothetical protein
MTAPIRYSPSYRERLRKLYAGLPLADLEHLSRLTERANSRSAFHPDTYKFLRDHFDTEIATAQGKIF